MGLGRDRIEFQGPVKLWPSLPERLCKGHRAIAGPVVRQQQESVGKSNMCRGVVRVTPQRFFKMLLPALNVFSGSFVEQLLAEKIMFIGLNVRSALNLGRDKRLATKN